MCARSKHPSKPHVSKRKEHTDRAQQSQPRCKQRTIPNTATAVLKRRKAQRSEPPRRAVPTVADPAHRQSISLSSVGESLPARESRATYTYKGQCWWATATQQGPSHHTHAQVPAVLHRHQKASSCKPAAPGTHTTNLWHSERHPQSHGTQLFHVHKASHIGGRHVLVKPGATTCFSPCSYHPPRDLGIAVA